jgi:hypothetical protein
MSFIPVSLGMKRLRIRLKSLDIRPKVYASINALAEEAFVGSWPQETTKEIISIDPA